MPTAFTFTAVQFSLAALKRRAIVSYPGRVLFFVAVFIGAGAAINFPHMPTLGKRLYPIGFISVLGFVSKTWTPIEKSTVLIGLQTWMLANRILWLGIGLGILGFTYQRFRFSQLQTAPLLGPRNVRARRNRETEGGSASGLSIQRAAALTGRRTFGFATHSRHNWMRFVFLAPF